MGLAESKWHTTNFCGAGCAHLDFVEFLQRHGIHLVECWILLGRPYLLPRSLFCELFHHCQSAGAGNAWLRDGKDVGVHCTEAESAVFDRFWILWNHLENLYKSTGAMAGVTALPSALNSKTAPGGRAISSARVGSNARGSMMENVVDALPLLSATCIILPRDIDTRVAQLMRIYDFDDKNALNCAELFILLHQGLRGFCQICDVGNASFISAEYIESVRDMCMASVPESVRNDTAVRLERESLIGVLVPLLRELGNISVFKWQSSRSMSHLGTCRDDLRPDMHVGALFMGRYKVLRRMRPSSRHTYFKKIILAVVDEIEQTQCAIKVLIPLRSDPAHHARNFMREAALLAARAHQFLTPLVSYGNAGDFLFQISALLEGCTLCNHLCRLKTTSEMEGSVCGMAEADIIQMLLGLVSGLAFLLDHGIVHSAICPQAIFLERQLPSQVKLLHWDLAKWDVEKVLGHTCDLLQPFPEVCEERDMHYASPEQCECSASTPAIGWDIYALGCVAYECVALRPPFVGSCLAGSTQKIHSYVAASSPSQANQHLLTTAASNIVSSLGSARPKLSRVSAPSITNDNASTHHIGSQQNVSTSLLQSETHIHTLNVDTCAEALRKEHVSGLVPDITDFLISNDFIQILYKMLEKSPAYRYREYAVLVGDLSDLLRDLQSLPRSMQECLPHLRSGLSGLSRADKDAGGGSESADGSSSDDHCAACHGGQRRKCLDLRDEPKSDFISKYLAKFASELSVDEIRITGGVIPLHLLQNAETRELDLRDRKLGSHDLMVLARCFGRVDGLEVFNLSSNAIAYTNAHFKAVSPRNYELSGVRRLSQSFASLPLVSLDLSDNSLGREGGAIVCSAVARCAKTLQSLRLGFCEIMPMGGLALAASMKDLAQLQVLDLSHCYIGDEGAIAISASLQHVQSLETFSLFSNSIDNEGGTAVMSALESNFILLSLSLGENSIPDVHLRVIQRAISFNNQYKSLKQRNDKFEGFGHNLMAESLKTWARGDMFIAQRLLFRLQHPRDCLEEDVARLLLAADKQSVVLQAVDQLSRSVRKKSSSEHVAEEKESGG